MGAQTPEWQPRVAAGREGELGLRAKHLRDRAHRRQRRRLVEHMQVVENEHDRSRLRESLEGVQPDGLDRVQSAADMGHQASRVVVARVQAHPGEWTLVLGIPLRQQRRLPVAGRRDE